WAQTGCEKLDDSWGSTNRQLQHDSSTNCITDQSQSSITTRARLTSRAFSSPTYTIAQVFIVTGEREAAKAHAV
ncbi:UNVERIFIED_CONTAM: hypothetical protein NY603_21775, partial [Bacteroidetes bacterium 56_B9]